MRINSKFASKRKTEIILYKPKYFIMSEGSETEVAYFNGLSHSIIAENVTIINVLRDYAKTNNSHPSFIIKMVKEFFLNKKFKKMTILELKNKLDNFFVENNQNIDKKEIFRKVNCAYEDNEVLNNDEIADLLMKIFKGDIYKEAINSFNSYLEEQDITYSDSIDTINIVIDRDKQNFKENQYDDVVKYCKENGVNLFVSNPTFEFWLLLHFPNVENENNKTLLENKYITKSKRYLEKKLNEICNYNKSNLIFSCFEPFIEDAIKREKKYAEDLDELKNKLGSNVGLFIERILSIK